MTDINNNPAHVSNQSANGKHAQSHGSDFSIFLDPHFKQKLIEVEHRMARELDVADGKNDGLIHKQAALDYLAGKIQHAVHAGEKGMAIGYQFDRDAIERDTRDVIARPSNVELDAKVEHAFSQMTRSVHSASKQAPVLNTWPAPPHQQAEHSLQNSSPAVHCEHDSFLGIPLPTTTCKPVTQVKQR